MAKITPKGSTKPAAKTQSKKVVSKKEKPVDEDKLTSKTKARSNNLKPVEMDIDFGKGKAPIKSKAWQVKDFKGADYNPRYITETRLRKLAKSMQSFGDLSGVVFNARTNRLISGHQRLKTIDGHKTRIITKPHTDSHGTVEVGHIEAMTPKGLIKIPLRIVDWSNNKVEKAANLAANSHGGEFDQDKLRKVLVDLDTNTFDIELLGLDPITIMSLSIPKTAATGSGKHGSVNPDLEGDDDEDGECGFERYTPDSFELSCQCPRCGYKFDPKTKRETKPSKITAAKKKDGVKKVKPEASSKTKKAVAPVKKAPAKVIEKATKKAISTLKKPVAKKATAPAKKKTTR